MFFKIALSVLVVIVVLLLFAAARPNTFPVQRSIMIHASQEKVFSLIDDLTPGKHGLVTTEETEAVQKIYSDPANGMRARAEWHGRGRAGAAKMLITESVVPTEVSVKGPGGLAQAI